MPAIAQDIAKTQAQFYWHLGDLHAIYDFDEDIMNRPGAKRPTIYDYENSVWQDMIVSQINYFKLPFFLGIGNHETTPPKACADYLVQFADWLNMSPLRNSG